MKKLIVRILKINAFGRWLYKPLHALYRLYSVPHRRRLLKRYGPEVLFDLAEIFKRHQISAFAAYGTMLGFVRDHGFIPHDDDMDIGIMPNTMTPQQLLHILLEKEKGFQVLFIFKFREGVVEFKVEYKHIPIDFFFFEGDENEVRCPLFFFREEVNYPSPNANSMKILHLPPFKGITTVPVYGCDFPVLEDTENALAALYGESWRIPDKKWNDEKRPHIDDISEFGYSISLEEAFQLEPQSNT